MKKITFFATFLIVMASAFTSCETEPIDPVLLDYENEIGTDDGEDTDDTGSDDGNSDGDYWPMALNNEWLFDSTEENFDSMKIIGTETIGGAMYYELDNFFTPETTEGQITGTAHTYIRKEGGSYSQLVTVTFPPAEPGMPTISVSPYELTFLKDNLAVGGTWTDTATQTTTFDIPGFPPFEIVIALEGTIMEKGVTLTVEGETYDDVIKSKLEQNVAGMSVVSYNWFAKNVGLIKSESTGSGINSTMVLTDYTVN